MLKTLTTEKLKEWRKTVAILAVGRAVIRLRVLEQGAKWEPSSLVRRPNGENEHAAGCYSTKG